MLPLAKRYFYQSLNKYDPDDDERHDDDDVDAFPKHFLNMSPPNPG